MTVVIAKSYVEYRNEGYRGEETRVSLDSIVYAFRDGLSPENIVLGLEREDLPSLWA